MPKLSNKLVSINEAAAILGVSKKTLRRWESAGKLTPVRTEGGHRRYSVSKLEDFKKAKKEAKRAKRTKPNVGPITPIEAPTPFQAYPQTSSKPQQTTAESPILTKNPVEESIYTPLHINQAKVLKNFSRFSFAAIALFVVAKILFTIPSLALNFSNNSNFAEKVSFLALLNKNEVIDQDGQVLATRDSLLSSRLDVNIDTTFSEDVTVEGILSLNGNTITSAGDLTISPIGGAVIIGDATATNADLADGDLVISGDFEANGSTFAVNNTLTGNQVVAGDTQTGSLTINGETFTDLTGAGLAINNGVLDTTLGATITGAEIEEGTIAEANLNVTNTAGDNQILSYDSGTGTFTWVDDQTGETSPWTDAGSLIYADTTTDNLTLGGSTELAKLGIDGDTDEIQLLVQAHSTQTNDLVVFEQSDGTDLVTFDNDGQITFSPTGFASSFTLYGSATQIDSGDSSIIEAINTAYNTAAAGGLWTDGGAITYLGSTTDDLALGGTDNTSPFYMDVSTGILALTGGVNVNSETVSDFTGSGLTLSSGALTVNTLASADGLSATASSGSGLEVLSSGVGLLQGCANGEILKWNETTDVWACASDAGATSAIINVQENGTPIGTDVDTLNFLTDFDLVDNTSTIDIQIADNALDFTEFTNTLTLDDNTSISTAAYALSIDALTFDGTSITSSGALSLDDSTLSSAITLSDTDTAFASGDTAIVDAINTAYNAATGGTGSLITHADHYLYATDYWADDFIVGGNSTASADIQLFADGSAVFNQQGNDSDFRVEGDTNENLIFADASTNRVGIGINTPEYPLHVAGQALIELGGNSAYFRIQNSSSTQIAALGADPSGDGTFIMYDSAGVLRNILATDGGSSYIGQGNFGIGDATPASLFTVGSGDLFQVNSSGNIASIGGVAHTIGNSAGNLSITSLAEIELNDTNLSSAIKISEDDATLPNSNTGIVDAINDAYTLAAAADPSTTNELQDLFSTFSVSGQSDVVADANSDTLTLAAGSGVTITTDAGTDSITISATGTGGDVVGPASSTDNAIARFDLATGKLIQNSGVIIDDSNNVSGLASLTLDAGGSLRTSTSATNTALLQAYDVDGASYTTFGTLTAGNTPSFDLSTDVTIGSAYIYRVGGTDVSLADGGTGASLSDPGADRILFWDDTAGATTWLAADGSSVEISGTTLQLVDGSSQASVDNSGQTVIQDITLDTYGRVTSLASVDLSSSFDNYASWTFATDGTSQDTITSADVLDFVSGNDIDVTRSADDQLTFALESTLNSVGTITRDSASLTLSTTTSGDISLVSVGDIIFNDTRTGDIALSASDSTFDSGDTAIVDAINTAYQAATGGTGALLTHADHYLYATEYWADDFVVGGNSTASADIQLFANGAAVFNEQSNDADFRIEGNTDANLFFADASADNIGIGTNSPDTKLEVVDTSSQLRIGYNATNYSDFQVNSNGSLLISTTADTNGVIALQSTGQIQLGGNSVNTYINAMNASNVEGFRLRSNGSSYFLGGNVGIGDSTPAALFTVGDTDLFQVNSSGNIASIGGVAHTIGNSTGNLAFTSPAEISFDDVNLTSAVKISEDDAALPNSNTGIVDAINDAYTLAAAADNYANWNINVDSAGNDAIGSGDALLVNAGSNVTLTYTAGTNTLEIASTDTNTTYSAGNDLDLSGTTFNIESELNFVNSITRDSGNLALSTTTSGDITLSSVADISFNDSNLSSAITLTDTDSSFTSGDTAIVDAINSAYAAATGGTGALLTHADHYLYATDYWADDFVVGGNSTASADIQLFANGAATFNEQGNNADFRIEGDTAANLFFADASTDRIGIGTNSPTARLSVADGRIVISGTSGSGEAINVSNSEIINFDRSTVRADQYQGSLVSNQLEFRGGTNNTRFLSSNALSELMTITDAGNVGIGGDTTPNSLFSVGSTSQFQVNSSGNIASIGGVAHTIADASGDLTLTSNADLFFNDSVQTSALALSDVDDGFDSGDTAIVDAINTAYNAATGGGGSGVWTLDSNTIYPTSSDDRVGIGTTTAASIISKLYISGNANLTGKSLAILNQTESEDIFTASASGTTRFAIANNGEVRLYDTDASHYSGFVANGTTTEALVYTLPAADGSANQVLATDSNGNLSWIDATAGSGGVGDITAVGDVDTAAAFTQTAGDDGNSLWFEGTTSDGNELQLTAADVANDTTVVTLPAITGTLASLAGSQTFTGAKTFSGGITNSAGEILVSGGNVQLNDSVALTLGTGDDTSIQFNGTDALFSTAGDFNFTAADDFIFDDAQLSSAITLTDTATSFTSGDTAIVDAINAAYAAATGGTGALLTHADHYLYATDYWADDFVVGGNSTASADIQLFANGAAVFNEQSNDADFRIEGNANANLFFADASADRIGIGTNTPSSRLQVVDNTASAIGFTLTNTADDARLRLSGASSSWDLRTSGTSVALYDVTNSVSPFSVEQGAAANTLVVDSNDRVGIGTATPGVKLDIVNAGSGGRVNALRLGQQSYAVGDYQQLVFSDNSGPTAYAGIMGGADGSGSFGLELSGRNFMKFYTGANVGSGTERMRITSAGNVGIGDTSPASLFTVGDTDLFQINSSGIIAAIDGVAHTISDETGDLTLTSNSTSVDIADNLDVSGTTGLTLSGTGGQIAFANGETIDNDSDNQINLNLGASGTLLLTSSTEATLTNTAGDLNIAGIGNISFDDGTLSSAITLTDVATSFTSGDTAIVDAINAAYNAATGGTGALLTHADHYLYATDYWADDFIVGGNSTASADIQLFANGAAVFNEQSNDADFRIEGNTDANLFFADASTDRIGIGTTAPENKLSLVQAAGTPATSLLSLRNENLAVGDTNSLLFRHSTQASADNYYAAIQSYLPGGNAIDLRFVTQSNLATRAVNMVIKGDGKVGIGDISPASLFTVGNGDLFQVNSSGIIAAIDGVAHTIDDVSGNLTITSNSTDVVVNDNLTVYQALRFANNEYIASSSNGFIQFVGAGGADNTDLSLDLEGTRPRLYSATDSIIQIAEDLEVSGTTGITLTGTGGQIAFANGETIDNDSDNQINLNLGASGTLLLTSSTEATLTNTAGDLNIAGIGNISFDDGTLSSAITLSDTDTSFTSGDTAIVDAINAAYAAATGGASSLLTHADHYLYATDYWADDFVVGGNSTASADIQLFANGAAVFNEQSNDADFRIEGNTDANLFFADASTDRVGIGTTSPTSKLEVTGELRVNASQLRLAGSNHYLLQNSGTSFRIQNGSSASTPVTIESSSASNILYLNSTGNVGIGTTAPDARLEINHATGDNLRLTYNDADGSAANYTDFSLSSSGDLTIAPSGGDTNITGDTTISSQLAVGTTIGSGIGANILNSSSASSGTEYGTLSSYTNTTAGTQSGHGLYGSAQATNNDQTGVYTGVFGRGYKLGTGTLSNARGVQGQIVNNGGGTISNAHVIYAGATLSNSSTIGTLYNIYVETPSVSTSTLTTNYGVYLADQNTGGTNYGIFTNLGDNSFGDDILLRNDNDRLQIGAGGDLDLYHDGTDSYIANATGDLNITTADDIIFDDLQLSSAITLTDTATSFDSGDTAIVDAINTAYQAATGGTGALLTHADHYLYATDYWADDFIVGGNSTASADIQLFANGAATFNEQSNDADFRIEGNTDANLFFADASTDRIGIGTNTPSSLLHVSGSTAGSTIATTIENTNNSNLSSNAELQITTGGNSSGDPFINLSSTTNDWSLGLDNSDSDTFKIDFGSSVGSNTKLAILSSGNVGIGDSSPASLFTVGSGDLFQVNSSGIIASVDGVAHTISDETGDLTLTSNSTSVDVADNLDVSGTTGLTLSGAGGEIAFANGETIDNDTNGSIVFSEATNSITFDLDATNPTLSSSTGTIANSSILDQNNSLDIDVNSATAFTLGDGATDFLTVDTTADAADTVFTFDGTGVSTGKLGYFTADAITSGIGLDISANALTSGSAINLASTSTALTSGSLFALDWSATGSIASTADLFTINIGTGETISSFLNITDDGSDVFKVTQTGVTTAVPASFTAAGDVSVAYDLDFTNQTASYIKSDAPFYIEAGEVFESNNLTLTTYNSGNIVLDAAGGVLIDLPGSATTNALCHTTASGTTGEEIVDCSGAPSDYAEWYPVQANSQPGDVVGFSSEMFEYTASGAEADTGFVYELGSESINILQPANTTFLGIVSTAPYNTIGEDVKQAVDESGNTAIKAAPIALVGRVPANIASDSPAIVAGDMLALSTTQPGKVTKAVNSGQVVGQALQTWNPGDSAQILTFVKSTYYDANENTSDLANNVTELENRISSLELMIGGSESTESATTTFDDLALTSLSVSGDTVLGDTVIAGTLNVGSLQFDPTDNSINAIGILKVQPLALSNIEFMGGLITMDTEGNITANEITAEKYNVAGASAGTATLTADTVEVFVETTMVTNDSLIFTNPKSPIVYPLSVTERIEGEGFWVEILETEPADVDFDWWIVDRVTN